MGTQQQRRGRYPGWETQEFRVVLLLTEKGKSKEEGKEGGGGNQSILCCRLCDP